MHPVASLVGSIVGGVIAMFLFSMLIDWALVSRIADDRVKGAIGSVLAAYLIASFVYMFNAPWLGGGTFLIYLPGAAIAVIARAMLAYRKAQAEAELE